MGILTPELKIGPVTLHLYGLIIASSIFLGLWLAKRKAKFYQIPEKIFDDPLLFIPLILSLTGARLYHVLDYWSLYKMNPISILYIAGGGLGIWGAIFGAILGFFIVARVKNLDFYKVLDLASPSLLLGQTIGRIGNYINQEGFGPPTNAPWGIFIDPVNRPSQYQNFSHFHPTFFYEAALSLIGFIILSLVYKRIKSGQTFALYLIFYSLSRFLIEFWRIDTWVVAQMKVAHILSIAAFLLGLILFARKGLTKAP